MALEHIAPLELPPAQLAGVAGRDPALVPLVPDQGGLMQVAPAAPPAAVLVGGRVSGGVRGCSGGHSGLLLREVGPGEASLVHQRREEGALA